MQSGTRIHKTVHYFLMEPTGGDLADHDHEFDEVRWIPFADAPSILTFETERALVAAPRSSRPAPPTASPGRPRDRAGGASTDPAPGPSPSRSARG